MMQPKFTPGPWEHDSGMYGNGKQYHSIFSPADDVVIAEFNAMPEFNPEQGKANANLIVSAPEMYAALKAIAYLTDHALIEMPRGERAAMVSALAKAEGGAA